MDNNTVLKLLFNCLVVDGGGPSCLPTPNDSPVAFDAAPPAPVAAANNNNNQEWQGDLELELHREERRMEAEKSKEKDRETESRKDGNEKVKRESRYE